MLAPCWLQMCPCTPAWCSTVPPVGFTLNCSSREAAVLPFDVGGLLLEPAAAKKKGGKKRPAPVTDSDEEEEAEAAGAAMLMELGVGSGKRPRRQGAGAKLGAIIADELELGLGEEEAGPSRALPARAAAVSSPAGTRRQLQLSARPFEEWMQETEDLDAGGSIPDDEGGPGKLRGAVMIDACSCAGVRWCAFAVLLPCLLSWWLLHCCCSCRCGGLLRRLLLCMPWHGLALLLTTGNPVLSNLYSGC